jgi:cell wall-associated NlpC family hydrolase
LKTRAEAVVIARSWLRTPYVLGGRIKGSGVDCATTLAEYLIEIGAATEAQLVEIGFYRDGGVSHSYSSDWFCHTSSQIYLRNLMRYGKLVAETVCRGGVEAQPGDLVLFRVVQSRLYNHGAIVTEWPRGIHAQHDGVREVDLSSHPLTAFHPMDIFDPFTVSPETDPYARI